MFLRHPAAGTRATSGCGVTASKVDVAVIDRVHTTFASAYRSLTMSIARHRQLDNDISTLRHCWLDRPSMTSTARGRHVGAAPASTAEALPPLCSADTPHLISTSTYRECWNFRARRYQGRPVNWKTRRPDQRRRRRDDSSICRHAASTFQPLSITPSDHDQQVTFSHEQTLICIPFPSTAHCSTTPHDHSRPSRSVGLVPHHAVPPP